MATRTITSRRNPDEVSRRRPQDVDVHVATRLRERRMLLGLTQQQLGELIGTTYQQTHEYEKGVNRIATSRLYQIAEVLGVEFGYFFDGMDGERAGNPTPRQRLLLELVRCFTAIPDERHRAALCDLARVLAIAEPSVGEDDQVAGAIVLTECREKAAV